MGPCERQRSSSYDFLSILLHVTSLYDIHVKTIEEKKRLVTNIFSNIPL